MYVLLEMKEKKRKKRAFTVLSSFTFGFEKLLTKKCLDLRLLII